MIAAGIAGADAGVLVARAFEAGDLDRQFDGRRVSVIAAGKAAAPMVAAFLARCGAPVGAALAVATHRDRDLPAAVEWHEASHPVPDDRSTAAARRALALAGAIAADEWLVLLLSGGASALLACPADGLTLDDKRHTTRTLMQAGADITGLNTVRKHLSAIKGGRLAAVCAGHTLTLAVSDVVGDDLSVIGSGPGVPDATTYADALETLLAYGGRSAYRPSVVAHLERGAAGGLPETPAPGDPAIARAVARVIGGADDAVRAAKARAEALGYGVAVLPEAVAGEARETAPGWLRRALAMARSLPRPVCVLSSGETTVTVTGAGRGGRNLEFALALAGPLADLDADIVAASAGTDGIDGPTDAAGALVDPGTLARARACGLPTPEDVLRRNDSYTFFAALDDLIRPGRTATNVGDVQAVLIG